MGRLSVFVSFFVCISSGTTLWAASIRGGAELRSVPGSHEEFVSIQRALEHRTDVRWEVLGDPYRKLPAVLYSEGVDLGLGQRYSDVQVAQAARQFLSANYDVLGVPGHDGSRQNAHRDELRLVKDGVARIESKQLTVVHFEQVRHGLAILHSKLSVQVQKGKLVQILLHLYPDAPCTDVCPIPRSSKQVEITSHRIYPVAKDDGTFSYRWVDRKKAVPTFEVSIEEPYHHGHKREMGEGDRPSIYYEDLTSGEVLYQKPVTREIGGVVRGKIYQRSPLEAEISKIVPSPLPDIGLWAGELHTVTNALGIFSLALNPDVVRFMLQGNLTNVVRCAYQSGRHSPSSRCHMPRQFPIRKPSSTFDVEIVDRRPAEPNQNVIYWEGVSMAERNLMYHINKIRTWTRGHAEGLPISWINESVTARIHNTVSSKTLSWSGSMGGGCGAEFDAEEFPPTLNFYARGEAFAEDRRLECHHTAEVADVIYHEWAHGVYHSLINFDFDREDQAANEATSDILTFHLTGDHQIGVGLFVSGMEPAQGNFVRDVRPLRRYYVSMKSDPLNPMGPHEESLIFSGAMWDLRQLMIARYGNKNGNTVSLRLFLQALTVSQTYTDFYDALLLADDNDGNRFNGTPHEILIRRAFSRHCLAHSFENDPICNVPASQLERLRSGLFAN